VVSSSSGSRKEQCLENTADGIEFPIWVFLSRFWLAPQHVIEMQENNFVMPGVVVGAFFLECSTQSHQLCSIESPSNDLVRFEQLIIHDTKLISPNTQWVFFHKYSAWLSMLKHGQIVPMISSSLGYRSGSIFHHQWLYDKKPFRLCLVSSISHVKKFNVSRFQFIWNPIPLLLNHSQWFQTIWNCLLSHS